MNDKAKMLEKINGFKDFSTYNYVIETFSNDLKIDLKISEIDLEKDLFDVNNKVVKWLQRLIKYSRYVELADTLVSCIRKSKYHYYKFEYKNHKIDRNDIKVYIESDNEYIEAKEIYDNVKHIFKFLEIAHKKVSEISFVHESIINWKTYMATRQ